MFGFTCFTSSHHNAFCNKRCSSNCSTKIYVKQFLAKLLCVYSSIKDELLLKYFRRIYVYLLMDTFGILKQQVWSLKHYCNKSFEATRLIIKTSLRQTVQSSRKHVETDLLLKTMRKTKKFFKTDITFRSSHRTSYIKRLLLESIQMFQESTCAALFWIKFQTGGLQFY